MVSKHPESSMLVDYSAGSLSPALCVSVSAHLHFCDTCRERSTQLAEIGGELLEDTTPVELTKGALATVLDRLEAPEPAAIEKPAKKLREDEALLPELVKNLLPDDGVKWNFLTRSLKVSRLAVGETDYELALHKIKAGGKTPNHGHNGLEITVVLQGSFSDEDGVYQEGDFLVREPGDYHRPTASLNENCICLSVLEAPIKLVGPVMRMLNPFFSTTPQ